VATDPKDINYEEDFGPRFQFHILAVMARLPTFILRYRSALQHTFFSDENHQIIAKALLQHVDENKRLPVPATLIEDCKALTSAQTMPYVEAVLDKLCQDDISDHAAVAKKVVEFGKVQALCVAIVESMELINSGNRAKIQGVFDRARLVGEDLLSLGSDYVVTVKERAASYALPEEDQETIATGIKHLDLAMDGGLGRGELGVIIAPPGRGKSTTLINIAFGALISASKYNVIHYSLEMPRKKVEKRYDDRLMGALVKTRSQDPEAYGRLLEERTEKFIKGRLITQWYNTRSASVNTFRSHLTMLAADGFRPDLIIVDYGDIVRAERRLGDMRHEVAGVYEDLRQLAGEFDAACWTASQGNKASLEKDIITIGEFSESFEKAAIVDAAVGFCQSKDERIASTCRLFLGKLRNTEDGSLVHCHIYRDRCAIMSDKLISAGGTTIAENFIYQGAERAVKPGIQERIIETNAKLAAIKGKNGIVPAAPSTGPVFKGPAKKSGSGPKRKMDKPSAKVPSA
jgi:replicative DNA helicase